MGIVINENKQVFFYEVFISNLYEKNFIKLFKKQKKIIFRKLVGHVLQVVNEKDLKLGQLMVFAVQHGIELVK